MFKWLSAKAYSYPFGEKVGFCKQTFKPKLIFLRHIAIVRTCKMKQNAVLQVFSMAMDLRYPPITTPISKNLFGVADTG